MSRLHLIGATAPDDKFSLLSLSMPRLAGGSTPSCHFSSLRAKWRRASFVPRVWSHVHISSESLDPVAKTRLWLSRALQSPLSVTIDVRVFDPHILDAFELILEHASQWRTLTLNTRFAQQANDILSQCRRSRPHSANC